MNNYDSNDSASKQTSVKRISAILVKAGIAIFALLVFPHFLPYFVGAILVVAFLMKRQTIVSLIAIVTLLLIKWPEPTLSLGIFAICISAIIWRRWSDTETPRKIQMAELGIALICWGFWAVEHHAGCSSSTNTRANPNGPIVCLGDSLTDYGYPQSLENLLNVPVADFGFNGYTTVDAIKLIPEINQLQPQAVVIEIGGHDYKNYTPRNETYKNLQTLIESFHDAGAVVILAEIPRGFVNDPWYGFERQLARQYDLELIPDSMIRQLIFWSPIIPPGQWVGADQQLSKDGLHPNQAGNEMMAEMVAKRLTKVLGAEIRE